MPGSYQRVLLHIVFSTHQRTPSLTPERRNRIFPYMGGLLRELGCEFVMVNGFTDHAHVICSLPVSHSLMDLVGKLKANSSKWIRRAVPEMEDFHWQTGYAAFSFSRKQLDAVCRYVQRQEFHHQTRTFEEEYRELLDLAGVVYEEQHLFA